MSKGATKKISLKAEVKESRIKLQMLSKYFKQYDLTEHYLNYVRALAEGRELPKKLKIDE